MAHGWFCFEPVFFDLTSRKIPRWNAWKPTIATTAVQCSAVQCRPVLYCTVHTIIQSYTYKKILCACICVYNHWPSFIYLSMYSMHIIFIFYVYGSSLHRGLLWQDDEDDGKKKNDMSFPRLGVSAIDRWEFTPKKWIPHLDISGWLRNT